MTHLRPTGIFVCIIALVASHASRALNSTASVELTCLPGNAYLKSLVDSRFIDLYELPNMDTGKCVGEWSVYGGCCSVESLAKLVQTRDKEYMVRSEALDTELMAIQDMATKAAEKYNKTKFIEYGNFLRFSVQDVATTRMFFEASFIDFTNWIQQLSKILIEIKTSHQRCNKKFDQLRSASYCSMCSARSQIFFDQNRLLINERDCRDAIGSCDAFWNSLILIDSGFTKFERFLAEFSTKESLKFNNGIPVVSSSDIRHLSAMLDKLGIKRPIFMPQVKKDVNGQISVFIETVREKEFSKGSFKEVAALCEATVNFSSDLYLSDVEDAKKQAAYNGPRFKGSLKVSTDANSLQKTVTIQHTNSKMTWVTKPSANLVSEVASKPQTAQQVDQLNKTAPQNSVYLAKIATPVVKIQATASDQAIKYLKTNFKPRALFSSPSFDPFDNIGTSFLQSSISGTSDTIVCPIKICFKFNFSPLHKCMSLELKFP